MFKKILIANRGEIAVQRHTAAAGRVLGDIEGTGVGKALQLAENLRTPGLGLRAISGHGSLLGFVSPSILTELPFAFEPPSRNVTTGART